MAPVYVRDALHQADLELFERHLAAFHAALTRPHDIENMKVAVDVLAEASAPFGRIRWQLNKAIAKTAVEASLREAGLSASETPSRGQNV